jgi:DNA-binding transcriptional ArsR family regulator
MNALEQFLGSRTRSGILSCLFGTSPQRVHLRALVRETGSSLGTVQQDLKKLKAMGLISSERDGNRLYYSADPKHPLYSCLRELVQRTTGVYGILRESLGTEDIRYAYVFGSVATGSDIDLMVIGAVSLRKLASRLVEDTAKLGREINPHVMTLEEYLCRCAAGEHFISSVIGTERQMIVGDENELRGMEEERMAQRAPHVAAGNR